jgi:hypothetical protein
MGRGQLSHLGSIVERPFLRPRRQGHPVERGCGRTESLAEKDISPQGRALAKNTKGILILSQDKVHQNSYL